ncbi:MAG: hypothetical protein KKE44_10390 [Proteobacteria bacterium]|nr:hypothetical protein [Pseudomonadota bacterium]MBU1583132.1 hypothetical protein [Pseudomonadota bacterium]MBU2453384.1 hypothetical protein [Pseudomonadota bacterium]MBU2627149.1 hypothetical protein [Pseudomonadota bacterium]
MSVSKDLERLVEEIGNARNDRRGLMNNLKENLGRIKQETAGLRQESVNFLKSIGKDREEMTLSLHRRLDKDRAGLGVMEKERRKETGMDRSNRISSIRELKNELKSNLEGFMSDMKGYVTVRKADAKEDKIHRLGDIKFMKTEVGRMKQEIQTSLKQIRNSQTKVGEELSTFLKTFVSDIKAIEKGRKSSVNEFLGSVKAELSAMASAWGNVLSSVSPDEPETVQKRVAPEPDKEEETGEEPEEQRMSDVNGKPEDSYYDTGPIKEKVVTTLSDYSEGLKMTQLAELLDIEQWRMLIPVMRDLLESKLIKKEGGFYFAS